MTHTISTAIKETWDIDGTDEDWLLAPTGSIAVNDSAISIDADHPLNRIVLQGAVTTLAHGAIGLDAAAQVKVSVADGAEIRAEAGYKIGVHRAASIGELFLERHGTNARVGLDDGDGHFVRTLIPRDVDVSTLTADDFVFGYDPPHLPVS